MILLNVIAGIVNIGYALYLYLVRKQAYEEKVFNPWTLSGAIIILVIVGVLNLKVGVFE